MYKGIFFFLATVTTIMTAEFGFDNDRCYKDKIGMLNEIWVPYPNFIYLMYFETC